MSPTPDGPSPGRPDVAIDQGRVPEVRLREVRDADLPLFFQHQLDPEASRQAAFTREDPGDLGSFLDHWRRLLTDAAVTPRTVLVGDAVAGHVVSFDGGGATEITYWIDRKHWGKGVATEALTQMLRYVATRPLHARVAVDNAASLRVLKKCGFLICGRDRAFSNARREEIEELILRLECSP
jgi:RimJ/RimL family protein N-acetyltransferase